MQWKQWDCRTFCSLDLWEERNHPSWFLKFKKIVFSEISPALCRQVLVIKVIFAGQSPKEIFGKHDIFSKYSSLFSTCKVSLKHTLHFLTYFQKRISINHLSAITGLLLPRLFKFYRRANEVVDQMPINSSNSLTFDYLSIPKTILSCMLPLLDLFPSPNNQLTNQSYQ